jgi:hypothetical protein
MSNNHSVRTTLLLAATQLKAQGIDSETAKLEVLVGRKSETHSAEWNPSKTLHTADNATLIRPTKSN